MPLMHLALIVLKHLQSRLGWCNRPHDVLRVRGSVYTALQTSIFVRTTLWSVTTAKEDVYHGMPSLCGNSPRTLTSAVVFLCRLHGHVHHTV